MDILELFGDPTTRAAFANREEAKVVADAQNRWTEIRLEGIDTWFKTNNNFIRV